ncbi:MAG: ABC transporter permease [Solobacterium sp.]|nr:ABC transporter permease [Solobacterium sp.]
MNEKVSFFKRPGVQTFVSSIICVVFGLLLGFIILFVINSKGAVTGIVTLLKNFMNYPSQAAQMKYLGNTLVKMAPLLMCALSICFCYKAGLFNIGAAGQYVVGAGACLYAALALKLPWIVCMLCAAVVGALWGMVVGFLKANLNVNEVISGIMLNWIGLYLVNMSLSGVKELSSPYTLKLTSVNPSALLPSMGLSALFSKNQYVTIAIPLSILTAVLLWFILNKTTFGYELKATGFNKEAARYAGMKEKRNIIVTLMIGGALAGIGAAFLYLTGFEEWSVSQAAVPSMGFNGIAATFLGGLNPIGTIFASYFIQHITSGGAYLDKALYPSQCSDLIIALIIYLCGFVLFFKTVMNRPKKAPVKDTRFKPEEKGGKQA